MTQGEKGFTVWFTGLSGSGKSTIAEMLYHELQARGLKTEILDGDEVRKNLSKGLGFSKEDRDTNILRIAFVADLLTRNGVATICCPISPYKETRDAARAQIGEFVEVHVHATVDGDRRAPRPEGPLQEGARRRDHRVHRRRRPVRGAGEPRAADRHRVRGPRGVVAARPGHAEVARLHRRRDADDPGRPASTRA